MVSYHLDVMVRAAAALAAERAPSFSERISVQWLPTEELLCHPAGEPADFVDDWMDMILVHLGATAQ